MSEIHISTGEIIQKACATCSICVPQEKFIGTNTGHVRMSIKKHDAPCGLPCLGGGVSGPQYQEGVHGKQGSCPRCLRSTKTLEWIDEERATVCAGKNDRCHFPNTEADQEKDTVLEAIANRALIWWTNIEEEAGSLAQMIGMTEREEEATKDALCRAYDAGILEERKKSELMKDVVEAARLDLADDREWLGMRRVILAFHILDKQKEE